MTRAVVIMKAGDPAIAGAIEDGMRAAIAKRPEKKWKPDPGEHEIIRTVEAEMERQRKARQLVRVAVGNTKTDDDYDMLITKARAEYGASGPATRIGRWMLGLYGLAVEGIARAYRAQDMVLGGRS